MIIARRTASAGWSNTISRYLLHPVSLIIVFSVFAWAALLQPGYFLNAHDAQHTIMFLLEFDANIKAGVFYPRWAPDWGLGYGYPIFTFYAPLVYYVAEGFHLIGFGLVESVKATYILGFIGAALTMYLYAGSLLGKRAGMVAALVYTYTPYHLVDIYVRSALAEFWSFVWFPLILWSFHRLIMGAQDWSSRLRAIAIAGLAYAGLMMTHNGTAFIFAGVLGPYVLFLLFLKWKADHRVPVREIVAGLAAGGVTLLLTAIFWLPLVGERNFVKIEQWIPANYDYHKHFVYLFQFLSPLWEFGYSNGLEGQMPLQLGLAPLILGLAGLVAVWWQPAGKPSRRFLTFWAIWGLALSALMFSFSAPIWGSLPIAPFLQFPWRLLAITTLVLALLSGAVVYFQTNESGEMRDERLTRSEMLLLLPLLLVVVIFSYTYTVPQFTDVPAEDLTPAIVINYDMVNPPERTAVVAWTKVGPTDSPLVAQYRARTPLVKATAPNATVEPGPYTAVSSQVTVMAQQPTTLTWYTYYYPGWHAYLDGREVAVTPDNNHGLMTMPLPAGQHTALIKYTGTSLHIVSMLITLVGVLVTLVLLFLAQRGRRR